MVFPNQASKDPTLVPDNHQHYVPQFLLKIFTTATRNRQIWVFDKHDEKQFKTSVRNVANQQGFYDYVIDGARQSLDPALQRLETAVAEDIRSLVQHRVLPSNIETRTRLAVFVSVQNLRTDAARQQYRHLGESLRQAIEHRGGPGAAAFMPYSTPEESYAQAIKMIPSLSRSAASHILQKSWILYSTTSRHPFYISDNPVTLDNTLNQHELKGTLGLAVPGIEIYLPVSDTLCMGFLCPTIEAKLRDSLARAEALGVPAPGLDLCHLRSFANAFNGHGEHVIDPQNVLHHNSLQVVNAGRYVFSRTQNFRLVSEIVTAQPEMKTGPRFNINWKG